MASITLYKRGCALMHNRSLCTKHDGGKRGVLDGKISSSSFRRLRRWCIEHDIVGDCWGITLTVPGLELISVDDFKRVHHKLCVWCNYHKVPLVWRVELQSRGMPHLHCVAFGDLALVFPVLIQWQKLLQSLPFCASLELITSASSDIVDINRAFCNGSYHAFDLQKLTGDYRAWRYLVTHMSKGKLRQLGWAGRNWGVCNRELFNDSDRVTFDLTDRQFFSVRRWLNRLYSGIPSKCKAKRINKHLEKFVHKEVVAHRKRQLGRKGDVFCVSNPDTVLAMVEFCRKIVEDCPF